MISKDTEFDHRDLSGRRLTEMVCRQNLLVSSPREWG